MSADTLDDLVLLTPEDVCHLLAVKKSWLYDEVQADRIPHVRLGQRLRFRKSDIIEYISSLSTNGHRTKDPSSGTPLANEEDDLSEG